MFLYGWIRYLIATDRGEVIWGIVIVIGVAVFTGSSAATLIAIAVVVAALVALARLNRVPRPAVAQAGREPAVVRGGYVAALVCIAIGALFYSLGLFHYGLGLAIFCLVAYVAYSVSQPRRS